MPAVAAKWRYPLTLTTALTALMALVAPMAHPAEAASPAPARFNPVTYNWDAAVGHRRPARLITRSALVMDRDNTVTSGLNTAVSKSGVFIDGGHNTTVTDSVLGGLYRVYDRKLESVRGILLHSTTTSSVVGSSFIAQYNDVTSDGDGFAPTGEGKLPTLIAYNKIHRDGSVVGDEHHDGIQFWQNGNTVIRRNWISGWGTSAILIKTDLAPISNIQISENYLENPTGYFSIYVRDGGKGRPRFIDIIDNAFGSKATPLSSGSNPRDQATFVRSAAQRRSAIAAGNASAAEWIVWSGNYWADGPRKGKEVRPPGKWAAVGLLHPIPQRQLTK